ncbi:magnesium transporter NIPA-domain-containing protein [Protomyces lactucae-debilis]|uniref:Magnesium transporter NIPA-domain-containing protein n=1 Tax=Protomyces lactucae-debilis TaxID=2754530 RepID=A0A1Y2EXM3_PROLT|nr:magnesium transporter NIPA-domain-containing protein [Protomyces lactucae-debilis]ORY76361.1 magnesium transporter NIPA-domain-containing protein [Protomyces lactucae-debilis]
MKTDRPWLGPLLSICGNVVVSLSLNVQRLAHKKLDTAAGLGSQDSRDPDGASEKGSSYLRSGWWWAGMILMVIGETGNFLAYAFAPASIVAPLGTTALIANVFLAPLLLKERFRRIDLLGVAIAIGGAVTVVSSVPPDQPELKPKQIWKAVGQLPFQIYLVISVCLMLVLARLSRTRGEQNILIDLGLVALLGGFTALSTKGVSSLLSILLVNAFKYPIFYIMAAVLIATAVLQVTYLNRALARFDSTQVIPTQFVLFTISTILGSAILYQDFARMSTKTIATLIGGCLLTFLGVWLISSGRSVPSSRDAEASTPEPISEPEPTTKVQQLRRTISALTESTPLLATKRSSSYMPQHHGTPTGGPLLSYFIAKRDEERRKQSFSQAQRPRLRPSTS